MSETSISERDSWFPPVMRVVAIVVLTLGVFLLGGRIGTIQTPSYPPGVAYATISMDCGGKTYVVSTGTGGGTCSANTDENGTTSGMSCGDGINGAEATCKGGKGVCTKASGSGSCTIPK